MKSFIYLLLSLIIKTSLAQEGLLVKVEDCRKDGSIFGSHYFQLLKDHHFVSEHKVSKKDTIQLNVPGNYSLSYQSIFNQKIEIPVRQKPTTQIITLCLDTLSLETISHTPFIDQIKNEEEILYNCKSRGCFYSREESFKIYKTNDTLKIKVHEFYYEYDENQNITKNIEHKIDRTLSGEEIEELRLFEMQLSSIHNSGCTSEDHYKIKYKNKKLNVIDAGCRWNGWDYLTTNLELYPDK